MSAETTLSLPRRRRRLGLRDGLEAYTLVVLLALFVVLFSVLPSTADVFLTSANLQILVANQVVPTIVALGVLIPLVCNQFDLSVGATTGLAAVFVASLLSGGGAAVVAIIVAVLLGAGVGTANALLVTRARVNGVITTLGVATVTAGVLSQKTNGRSIIADVPESLSTVANSNVVGVPAVALVLAVVAALVWFVLEHTPLGRQMYALGSNEAAAELVGIRTSRIVAISFILAGCLAGMAGLVFVARAGSADPGVGASFTLSGLAAAFLSTAAIKPGRFNVGGTLVAVFFLAVLNNGLVLAGAETYITSYVNGVALVAGVALAVHLQRRRGA